MAEESDNKLVSDEQINKVEAEIKAAQAEELKKVGEDQAKIIEDKVRKEYEVKAEKEALEKKIADQEEAIKKAQVDTDAKIKAQEDAFEKRIAELEATKKGVATNDNPFKGKEQEIDYAHQRILPNGKIVDTRNPQVMTEIEEESRKAWMAKVGIGNDAWGKPPN